MTGRFTGEELVFLYTRSPLSEPVVSIYLLYAVIFTMTGRFTGEKLVNFYSRSPLSEPEMGFWFFFSFIYMSGRLHREEEFSTLVLPSLNRKIGHHL